MSVEEIGRVLGVGRALAIGHAVDLTALLHAVADEAMRATHSDAVAILRTGPGGSQSVVASIGIAADQALRTQTEFPEWPEFDPLSPTVVGESEGDADLACRDCPDARRRLIEAGYDSMLAIPLVAGANAVGVLNLYQAHRRPWAREEVVLGAVLAQQAAGAVVSAGLIDLQQLQAGALERMATMLSEQTYDYANRLHAVSGLLALGEPGEAERLLAKMAALHHETCSSVAELVQDPTLAGLLVAQMNAGRQRGVEVNLQRSSHVAYLPPTIARSEAMLIVANLIQNAIEAAVDMEESRRRVSVRLIQSSQNVTVTVRDWRPGVEPVDIEAIVARTIGGVPESVAEVGLAAVAQAVWSAGGELTVQSGAHGTTHRVSLPLVPPDH